MDDKVNDALSGVDLTKLLSDRLDKAIKDSERWNVGQKVVAAIVLLGAAVLLVMGAAEPKVIISVVLALAAVSFLTLRRRIVEGEMFVLKDSQGILRALLASVNNQTYLFMKDLEGRLRLGLAVAEKGPALTLFDSREKLRASLTLLGDTPTMRLQSNDGEEMVEMLVPKGNPGLILTKNGKPAAMMSIRTDGTGHLTLLAEDGSRIWTTPTRSST